MRKIFVCSPLRGKDGQPSQVNIALARRLMKAVFRAGHAPFVPHLLYPQVLSESETDLKLAFEANFTWLSSACNEIWVWARRIEECTSGMKLEVSGDGIRWRPRVVWMPEPFLEVEREGWRAEALGKPGVLPPGSGLYLMGLTVSARVPNAPSPFRVVGPEGTCVKCGRYGELNREGWCLKCFSGGGGK